MYLKYTTACSIEQVRYLRKLVGMSFFQPGQTSGNDLQDQHAKDELAWRLGSKSSKNLGGLKFMRVYGVCNAFRLSSSVVVFVSPLWSHCGDCIWDDCNFPGVSPIIQDSRTFFLSYTAQPAQLPNNAHKAMICHAPMLPFFCIIGRLSSYAAMHPEV